MRSLRRQLAITALGEKSATVAPPLLISGLLCLALLVAGCGEGGDEDRARGKPPPPGQNFTADDLDRFMLKPSDLPSGYEQQRRSSGSAQDLVEAAETREEQSSLERVTAPGLEKFSSVVYRKKAGENSNKPGSTAFLYETPSAASQALPAVRRLLNDSYELTGDFDEEQPRKIRVSGLGDEAAAGIELPLGPYALFMYVWRARNIVVTLAAGDVLGDMSGKTILEIARKIDFRATG
ncbi:MAG: hypothetical protein M3N47_04315 [Chloroflexota bacterium]|nr:hypothetical protein [Chloroflexota bacterium]